MGVDLLVFFERGGFIMVVIAAVGGAGLFFFFDRLRALKRARVVPADLRDAVVSAVNQNDLDKARLICRQEKRQSPLSLVFLAVLQKHDGSLQEVKEAIEQVGSRQMIRLERRVKALGLVANISPLLGFLGSVVGMMHVFQRVNESGKGGMDVLSGGIWESLSTTAFGLMVGIPALVGHRYLLSQAEARSSDLEEQALRLLDVVYAQSTSAKSSSAKSSSAQNNDADDRALGAEESQTP